MKLYKPAYMLFLITGTYCNAGCISCPAGRKNPEEKEVSGLMSPETLERILSYVSAQGVIAEVYMFHYNEPTLHPHMPELLKLCHDRGLPCVMSTNGYSYARLEPILQAGLSSLIFSVSGTTDEIQQRSHKGIAWASLENSLKKTAEFIKHNKAFDGSPIKVSVRWHDYEYNQHQLPIMRQLCEDWGFEFLTAMPSMMPLERVAKMMEAYRIDSKTLPHPGERDLRVKLKQAMPLCEERKHFSCSFQRRILTVDSLGRLHNCCTQLSEANCRGSLFTKDLNEFNHYRLTQDEDCKRCKAHGHHVYGMIRYNEPLNWKTAGRELIGKLWHNLDLHGMFPKTTLKLTQKAQAWTQKLARRK